MSYFEDPPRRLACFLLLALPLVSVFSSVVEAAGEETDAREVSIALPIGEVVPEVVTLHDPEQRYSLFLPPGYDPKERWPVLFVLDPRGRAVPAIELFVAGAEEHGWIVLSSYQSRSDTAVAVTTAAFKAILRDAESRFAVDDRRFYLAGMSGTSFASWRFAQILEHHAAGMIGCAGGLPFELEAPEEVSFAYYGIAGTVDFNYQPTRRLDRQLAELGAVHRLELFEGGHGWPPDDRLTRLGIDWLELMAMKRGLVPKREGWIDGQLEKARAALAAAEDPGTTARRLDQLVRDFQGLRDVAAEKGRLAELERSRELRRWRHRERELAAAERGYGHRMAEWVLKMRATDVPPQPLARSLLELDVRKLQRQAAGDDPQVARSAQRRLESLYVQASFYLANEFEEAGELGRAAAVLEVAAASFPDRPRAAWRRVEVYTLSHRLDEAFEALETALHVGGYDLQRLRTHPVWEPLRQDPRWRRVVGEDQKK